MNTIANHSIEKPAYKQFWPWFLFTLPAIAVAASIYTLLIAQDMGHDKFLEGTQKIGRAVISGPAHKRKGSMPEGNETHAAPPALNKPQ
jgi:hypothetical protein